MAINPGFGYNNALLVLQNGQIGLTGWGVFINLTCLIFFN